MSMRMTTTTSFLPTRMSFWMDRIRRLESSERRIWSFHEQSRQPVRSAQPGPTSDPRAAGRHAPFLRCCRTRAAVSPIPRQSAVRAPLSLICPAPGKRALSLAGTDELDVSSILLDLLDLHHDELVHFWELLRVEPHLALILAFLCFALLLLSGPEGATMRRSSSGHQVKRRCAGGRLQRGEPAKPLLHPRRPHGGRARENPNVTRHSIAMISKDIETYPILPDASASCPCAGHDGAVLIRASSARPTKLLATALTGASLDA